MVKTSTLARGKKATAGLSRTPSKKNTSEANWGPSLVTEQKLKELVEEGLLPSQEEIKWRVPGDESRPAPQEGEAIVFAEHVIRGFWPPRSRFFSSGLHAYKLHPHDLSANSLLYLTLPGLLRGLSAKKTISRPFCRVLLLQAAD